MQVTIAETSGFCFGVKRAVDTVYREIEKEEGPIYTFGPIIHNESVVSDLAQKGVRVIEEADTEMGLPSKGTVIIRSHGITRAVKEELLAAGLNVVDATCPFVRKIHQIVQEESRSGRYIIIIGNASHPEVIGICGWCEGPYRVISGTQEMESFRPPEGMGVTIVSQTTFNFEYFQEIVEISKRLGYDVNVLNTICNATQERQSEAAELAEKSDIMLVVGSRSSSNTQKLYSICKAKCADTYYIQTLDDLITVHFRSDSRVGITAGASAPNNIIQEVSKYVRGT